MNIWILIGTGWLAAAVFMAVLWLVQRRTGDAGIVDVGWGLAIGLLAIGFSIASPEGDLGRRILVPSLSMIWALRLSGYVFWRVLSMPEDGRYTTLKESWKSSAQRKLFGFYQIQAVASLIFSIPILIAVRSPAPLGLPDIVGVAIWVLAISGETIADRQLARFRRREDTRGKVCRVGLWRYSRHPNYFFEWIHWWSYVAFAFTAPYGWFAVVGPLAMYYFITRVTGIPPTEAQAIKSRGDAYREYQRTTNAFFPWPPQASNRSG